jgi:hypothetical protein
MRCSKCQSDNREGVELFEKYGPQMELVCLNCGGKIPLEREFCGQYGQYLEKPKGTPRIDYSKPQSYTPKFLGHKIRTTLRSIEGYRYFSPNLGYVYTVTGDYPKAGERLSVVLNWPLLI